MATATMALPAIKLEYGVAQCFALKFVTGKNFESKYPPYTPRVMFSTTGGPLFLESEDGSDFERSIRDLGIEPGEEIRVVKVRHPKGGGHSIRVERVSDAAEPTNTEALLEKSIELVQRRAAAPAAASPVVKTAAAVPVIQERTAPIHARNDAAQPIITPQSARMCAAMCSAVDAILETQAYATRRGLGLTFSEESVRAIGLSIYIDACRGGR